jgi:hypothetical protein
MSGGAYGFSDPFVEIGLILWIVAVSLAEMLVWPGERLLQVIVSGVDGSGGGSGSAAVHTPVPLGGAPPEVTTNWVNTDRATAIATRVALSAWTVCVVLVFATIVMVQKP